MKEKLTLFVVAVFLLILIIKISVALSNIPGKQVSIRNDDIVIRAQTNAAFLNWTSISTNVTLPNKKGFTSLIASASASCHRSGIQAKIKYYNNYFNAKRNSSNDKYFYTNKQSNLINRPINSQSQFNSSYKIIQFPSEVVNFMVAITFVKLVIVVIAYQQLLHNGYIIIQNLYHKRIRQFEQLICNRPYQLKSGHGLDEDENFLEQPYQPHLIKNQQIRSLQQKGQQQFLKQVNDFIENIGVGEKYRPKNNIKTEQYGSIKTEQNELATVKILNSNNNQLYHQQQQLKDHNYYQQFDYNHYHNSKHHKNHRYYQYYYHENHRCFYQRDQQCFQGYCHQVEENLLNQNHQHAKTRMIREKRNFDNTSVSPILRQPSSVPSSPSKSKRLRVTTPVFKPKIARVCNNRLGDIPTSQQTTPVIPSLASLYPTICCWKTNGSRKRRKRKCNFGWDKYTRNCNYLIWKSSCTCSYCCCGDGLCDIFSRYSDYFHIHCYSRCDCSLFSCCCCYCICEINSNESVSQTTAVNYKFCNSKLNINNNNSVHKNNNSNQLNIINISKDVRSSSRQASRKWCIDASHHADTEVHNGSNLLRSLNAVKAITSAVHNRNYKRKLKKNLVWLFIGLVWLEGPKLINCSISHNNNDVTSISGNETTNKIGNSQSSNSDNGSGGSGSGGGRNGSRSSGGSSSNTNGPGASPRPDSAESKGQNVKSGNLLKITNSFEHSGSSNIESYNKNRIMQNTISIEQPLLIKKQYQYQTFHQQNRNQQREPYVVSRTGYNSNRPTKTPNSLFESEEANRAQSDLVRLESIKRQILTKLGLTEKPNVTHPLPKQFIWDTIYRADGIRSVSDFDFNDNHRTQEHMRLTAAVLEPPPLIPHHFPKIVNSITNMEDIRTERLRIGSGTKLNLTGKGNDASSSKNMFDSSWKLLNLTTAQLNEQEEQVLSQYQRKHRQQHKQQQQRLRGNKNSNTQNKNRYAEPDYFEGDDFFGSTQEIITFAEKGKIYKKHRLVEFSPPSNKIPKQKLQIRNAEIHIRIEKVSTHSSTTPGHLEQRHFHRHKYASSREPNLKIWIFQLIGNDFSSKGFDQVATLCTSLAVDHNVLGWQKLDITETVQFWYGKHQKDKLRLLIDCTGCGSRYVLHLFDRKFHHSLLSPSASGFRQPYPEMRENKNTNNNYTTASKLEEFDKNQTQRYYYHYRQYNHHRYRRKNRASPLHHTSKTLNASEIQNEEKLKETTTGINAPSLWLTTTKYRKSREIKNPNSSQEELEGISYEVGAEYHLEDRLNPNRPFLVLHTEPTRSRRVRRRAVDCTGAMHGQCCKESFYVSFKALGWDDWIIAPRGYFANYCRGDCTGPYRTPDTFQTFHAHFIEEYRKMGLLNGMQPCCAPVKFSSMSLIYYGDDGIIKRDLPKMVVDECGCP